MSTQARMVSTSAVIAVTGTAVPLSATDRWVCKVDLTAWAGNAAKIYYGSSVVVRTGTIVGGFLNKEDFVSLSVPDNRAINLAGIYINGTAGEGVAVNIFEEV